MLQHIIRNVAHDKRVPVHIAADVDAGTTLCGITIYMPLEYSGQVNQDEICGNCKRMTQYIIRNDAGYSEYVPVHIESDVRGKTLCGRVIGFPLRLRSAVGRYGQDTTCLNCKKRRERGN